jgi:hypothetical protein
MRWVGLGDTHDLQYNVSQGNHERGFQETYAKPVLLPIYTFLAPFNRVV